MAYLVAFWNLENLFAPEGFPGREPWIANAVRNDLRGWTQALFDQKVAQLASIIVQMKAGAGPDLLGVCEVENRFALEAVADQLNALRPARTINSFTSIRRATNAASIRPSSSTPTCSRRTCRSCSRTGS